MANIEKKEWRGVSIGRGSFITSIGKLAIDTGLTVKAVRIALDKLKKTSEILTEGASQWTMITVCKYDTYQQQTQSEGQRKGKRKGKQGANEGQTKGEPGATTKELKEGEDSQEGQEGIISRRVKFEIPTREEVKAYFSSNGFTEESASRFFEYYSVSGWVDSKGDKVRNWKQKAQAVWFKDTNKKPVKQTLVFPR